MNLKKHIGSFFIFILTLAVALFVAAFWWGVREFQKPGPLTEPVYFDVRAGDGLNKIADNLLKENAVSNPHIFVFGARLLGAENALKAGEYELTPAMSPRDILFKIHEGKVFQRRLTVPEGLTSYEIVLLVNGVQDMLGQVIAVPAEGSLLPETYDYRRDELRGDLITRMQQSMTGTLDELWEKRDPDLPLATKEEALILASIVEKETGKPEERKRIAGVFINRLKKGIALQTDPSVIYAITQGKPKTDGKGPLGRRLLTKDLEIDSPYNTYLHPGLPPGPIANPGRASIEAVLHPESNDFLYFVADGTGGHVFSKTLAEHNKNAAEWRKIRKSQ